NLELSALACNLPPCLTWRFLFTQISISLNYLASGRPAILLTHLKTRPKSVQIRTHNGTACRKRTRWTRLLLRSHSPRHSKMHWQQLCPPNFPMLLKHQRQLSPVSKRPSSLRPLRRFRLPPATTVHLICLRFCSHRKRSRLRSRRRIPLILRMYNNHQLPRPRLRQARLHILPRQLPCSPRHSCPLSWIRRQ